MINFGRLPYFGRLPSLVQIMKVSHRGFVPPPPCEFSNWLLPCVITSGNEPPAWPAASFGGQGRRLALLGRGIPLMNSPSRGRRLSCLHGHSGTHPCRPPQPPPPYFPPHSFRPPGLGAPPPFYLSRKFLCLDSPKL